MFADPRASLVSLFRVAVSLRSVTVSHELASALLERGFRPIAIQFNIEEANDHSSGALYMYANAINTFPISSFAHATGFITSNRNESDLINFDVAGAPCFLEATAQSWHYRSVTPLGMRSRCGSSRPR